MSATAADGAGGLPAAPAGTDMLAALVDSCRAHASAPALSHGGVSLTFGELGERIAGIRASLIARGMAVGDRVLFSVRPGIDSTCLALGIIAAGGTVVFADPGAGESMFRARADLAAARWVAAESLLYFASSRFLRPIARRRGLELPPYSSVVPQAKHIVAGRWLPGIPRGAVRLRELEKSAGEVGGGIERSLDFDLGDPSLPALIIFTSGTTSDPKAVVHSRLSLGTGLADFARHTQLAAGDRVLTDQLMVGVPALIAGAHWIMPPAGISPGATPDRYLDLLPGADVLFAVPAALDALLLLLETHPDRAPHLTTVIIGGAPVLRPLLERVRRQLPGVAIRAIYGMTEILPVAIADGDDKLAFDGEGDYVGELASTITARIVDGELRLTGPGLMLGYLGKEPQAEVATGDLARIVPAAQVVGGSRGTGGARLVLAGRSKDMFIRGTTNVYPGLFEPVIAGLAGVRDVAMVGVPDAIGDDRIVLVIVPSDPPVVTASPQVPSSPLTSAHPALAAITRALPGLIDAAVLPDVVLAIAELPRAGRARKLDRRALTELVAAYLAGAR